MPPGTVGSGSYCPLRRPTHCEPSSLELRGILYDAFLARSARPYSEGGAPQYQYYQGYPPAPPPPPPRAAASTGTPAWMLVGAGVALAVGGMKGMEMLGGKKEDMQSMMMKQMMKGMQQQAGGGAAPGGMPGMPGMGGMDQSTTLSTSRITV